MDAPKDANSCAKTILPLGGPRKSLPKADKQFWRVKMRVLKWGLGLLVLAIALPVLTFFLIPEERILAFVENQVETATGRAVTFEGGVSPSLWPELGVTTGPVEIANADWSDSGPILRAERLHVAIDPLKLLSGEIAIGDITADTPQVILETAQDGAVNWDFFDSTNGTEATSQTPSAPPSPETTRQKISLKNLSLTDAAIRFIDRQSGATVELVDIDVSVQTPHLTQPSRDRPPLWWARPHNGDARSQTH